MNAVAERCAETFPDDGFEMNTALRLMVPLCIAVLVGACATIAEPAPDHGQTYRDQPLAAAPHYAGPPERHDGRLLHVAVAIDPWTLGSLPPDALSVLQAINADLGTALDTVWDAPPLRAAMPSAGRPKVSVGLPPDDGSADFADVLPDRDGHLPALIRTWNGSRAWRDWAREQLAREQADYLLLVWSGIGAQYPVQRNGLGGKRLSIGSGHAPSLPWLTALDEPVEIVQLTGVLVDREGRVLRSGAEGMIAVPTRFSETVLGLRRTVQTSDLRTLPSRKRDDLPGQPRVIDVALDNLVAQLTGRGERIRR